MGHALVSDQRVGGTRVDCAAHLPGFHDPVGRRTRTHTRGKLSRLNGVRDSTGFFVSQLSRVMSLRIALLLFICCNVHAKVCI